MGGVCIDLVWWEEKVNRLEDAMIDFLVLGGDKWGESDGEGDKLNTQGW
jgi:hypothetical protein